MTDIAVVTGAAGGIGAATAKRLAADGLAVVVSDVAEDRTAPVVDAIAANGGRAFAQKLDVTDPEAWTACMAAARQRGTLKALINNAGILRDKSVVKTTMADWDAVIDTHLKGTFLGAQAAFAEMREHGGAIVNVSSTAARGSFGQSNYSAAKGGITALTRTLALEGARFGIRVNAIAPGAVNTAMTRDLPDAIRAKFMEAIPLLRFGEPEEMAAVVSFLISSDASYLTGQLLTVDGGATLGG